MSNDFKQKIIIDYNKKKIWQNLLVMLKNFIKRREQKLTFSKTSITKLSNNKSIIKTSKKRSNNSKKLIDVKTKFEVLFKRLRKFRIDIDFELVSNDLIYYIDFENRRLYISNVIKKKFSSWCTTIMRIRVFINVTID